MEPDYDYMFVEAHTVGQDDWTTLPGREREHVEAEIPAGGSCADGWAQPTARSPVPRALPEPGHVRADGHDR